MHRLYETKHATLFRSVACSVLDLTSPLGRPGGAYELNSSYLSPNTTSAALYSGSYAHRALPATP